MSDSKHDRSRCSTCGATYGLPVADRPERCGICITGLSIDGRPVYPVESASGLECPMCRSMGSTCRLVPHEEWPDAWSHDMSHLFPLTKEDA